MSLVPFLIFAALGAALGSFVALVLDRVPRGQSIVTPPSHCATCSRRLIPLDNVPIAAWLLLRGRCRYCKAFIPLRGFVLEIAGAAAGAALALRYF